MAMRVLPALPNTPLEQKIRIANILVRRDAIRLAKVTNGGR